MDKLPKTIAGSPDRPLKINGLEIDCYVLDEERRVIPQRAMATILGMTQGGPGSSKLESGVQFRRFTVNKWIKSFIDRDLAAGLKSPMKFISPKGITYGYPAEILAAVCVAIDKAARAGKTTSRQTKIVHHARILLEGFARVGVIGLVDEATGYEKIKKDRSLARLLEKFIAKELQPWVYTFPREYYKQIYRLKGKRWPPKGNYPQWVGSDTNNVVYARLAPKVLNELRERNPVLAAGYRRNRHHQWLNREVGHPQLEKYLIKVVAIMEVSASWEMFISLLNCRYPKIGRNYELPLW